MIWKKHGERLIEEGIILIVTNSINRNEEFLVERINVYEKQGYKVKIKYFEGKYEFNYNRTRKDFKKSR